MKYNKGRLNDLNAHAQARSGSRGARPAAAARPDWGRAAIKPRPTSAVCRIPYYILGAWNDRANWYGRRPGEAAWKERHAHSLLVHDDALVVFGGHTQPLGSDVWKLAVPADFFE